MLRCREVTRLHASDELERATFMTRMGVRLHLAMCRHCRRYVRELRRIGEAVRSVYAPGPTSAEGDGGRAADAARNESIVRRVLDDG